MGILHIGFTGTRKGMTEAQKETFTGLVAFWCYADMRYFFHHGDCIGADADAHEIVSRKASHIKIVLHPAQHKDRAGCGLVKGGGSVMEHNPKPPLERNQDIVNACRLLIACPSGPERLRSGTWATVRMFRRACRRLESTPGLYIIRPDGSIGES